MRLAHIKSFFLLIASSSLFVLVFFISGTVSSAEINGIRFWQDPEKTRVVFDLSDNVSYKIFTLSNPARLVIDLKQSKINTPVSKIELPDKLVNKIRTSDKSGNIRVVVDLTESVTTQDFTLKPYQKFGHRLVVDLKTKQRSNDKKRVVKTAERSSKNEKRDIIIAIDAGHGGEDPGAPGGEKDVCLAVAKKLAYLINQQKGMKAVLTRKGDYFVKLLKRTDIARQNKADLFVSLHADGFDDKRVKGASVWVLSPRGASSEMGRWLELKEKASDLAGGVDISHQDPLVAQVLIDLSMHYSLGESIKAGDLVRKQLVKSMPKMHGKGTKKANFAVLRMPDIPALLVEMGFISNPSENRLLKSTQHQNKIAKSVFNGVNGYFKNNAPDGTLYASLSTLELNRFTAVAVNKTVVKPRKQSYKVKSGDTLSQIAVNHGLSTSRLRRFNHLKNDRIRVGQVIKIPSV
jgi:N-acetylmuramoyl-L-alanine amidase